MSGDASLKVDAYKLGKSMRPTTLSQFWMGALEYLYQGDKSCQPFMVAFCASKHAPGPAFNIMVTHTVHHVCSTKIIEEIALAMLCVPSTSPEFDHLDSLKKILSELDVGTPKMKTTFAAIAQDCLVEFFVWDKEKVELTPLSGTRSRYFVVEECGAVSAVLKSIRTKFESLAKQLRFQK